VFWKQEFHTRMWQSQQEKIALQIVSPLRRIQIPPTMRLNKDWVRPPSAALAALRRNRNAWLHDDSENFCTGRNNGCKHTLAATQTAGLSGTAGHYKQVFRQHGQNGKAPHKRGPSPPSKKFWSLCKFFVVPVCTVTMGKQQNVCIIGRCVSSLSTRLNDLVGCQRRCFITYKEIYCYYRH
jgi:hypothetical protein